MKPSVMLWDMDGTLINSAEGVTGSARLAVAELGLPPVPEERLTEFIGPPLHWSFEHLCGLSPEDAQAAIPVYRKYYVEGGAIFKARVYDGIIEVLRRSAEMGVRHAVATNKKEDLAVRVCEHFGLMPYFTLVEGSDAAGLRSKSDMMLECLRKLGASREEALMIGDSSYDANGAEEAGIAFLPAMYGFGFRSDADIEKVPHIGKALRPLDILDFITL